MVSWKYGLILAIALLLGAGSVTAGGWGKLFGRGERGSGQMVTQARDLEPFDRIESHGSWDVDIVVGPNQSIELTFDDNLIDLIETEVDGGTLDIYCRDNYSSRRSCHIKITVPVLSDVRWRGSGDVTVENLKGEEFEFSLSGSGNFDLEGETQFMDISLSGSGDGTVRGSTGTLDVSISGSGDIDCRDLKADEVFAKVTGSGDLDVYARESFRGRVSGSGDIVYFGDPEHVKTRVSGSGDIRGR